jgi:hypothetical protein
MRRNPDWTRDEVILACDLVASNGWRSIDHDNRRVIELSRVFSSTTLTPCRAVAKTFATRMVSDARPRILPPGTLTTPRLRHGVGRPISKS